MNASDDWCLVADAQRGDMDAFRVLVERYQQPLVVFCYRMLGSYQDAEDVAQEAFVRLYRHLGRLAPDAQFSTVLFGIARNLTLNHLRDTGRRGRGRSVSMDDAPPIIAASAAPDQRARTQEMARWIAQALKMLSPEHREVLLLREIEGMDYERIAAVVGCRKGTVKSRIARAREQLRQILLDMGGRAL